MSYIIVKLRWIAILVLIISIYVYSYILNSPSNETVNFLWGGILLLIIFNFILYYFQLKKTYNFLSKIKVQITIDLIFFIWFIHFTGGIENPFIFLLLFQVILSGFSLYKNTSVTITVYSIFLLGGMSILEITGILSHYPNNLIINEKNLIYKNPYYVTAIWGIYTILAVGTNYFISVLTQRIRSEQNNLNLAVNKLNLEKQKTDMILKGTGIGVVLINSNLKVEWYNEQLKKWFPELSIEKDMNCPFNKHSSEYIICDECLCRNVVLTGKTGEREVIIEDSYNKRYFKQIFIPMDISSESIMYIMGIFIDITHEKNLRDTLRKKEKMASLGQFLAGIKHEIGNPLSSITMRLERMKSNNNPEFIKESLKIIENQVSRISFILHDFKHLSQISDDKMITSCYINSATDEALKLLETKLEKNKVKVCKSYSDNLPAVRVNYNEIVQVFINIIINACDAMSGKKVRKLTVSTHCNNNAVSVSFTDTGIGIPIQFKNKILKPFFTTKKDQGGTGLGLSLAHGLIKAHGGTLGIRSLPEQGTTFTVILPVNMKLLQKGKVYENINY